MPSGQSKTGGGGSSAPNDCEMLDYIADIASQVGELADRAGYRRLASLLAAAVEEARMENKKKSQDC
jgi:hypothetical protein